MKHIIKEKNYIELLMIGHIKIKFYTKPTFDNDYMEHISIRINKDLKAFDIVAEFKDQIDNKTLKLTDTELDGLINNILNDRDYEDYLITTIYNRLTNVRYFI